MSEVVWTKISGLEELQKTLEEIPQQLAKQGIRNALRAGAKIVRDAEAEEAPKDTGFLSEHFVIHTKMLSGKSIGGTAFIGPDGHMLYENQEKMPVMKVASLVEFGHQTRGPEGQYLHGKAGADRRMIPGNPFLTRAWERVKTAAREAVIDRLRIEVLAAALQKALGVK